MDIYDYLKKDHEAVNALFKLYHHAGDLHYKGEILAMIKDELLFHAKAEQETFYKAIKNNTKDKKFVHHGKEEHEEIEAKLREIKLQVKGEKTLDKKVKELEKLVDHHVNEEENKIFKQAKKIFNSIEACELKEKMHELKVKLARSAAA